MLFTTAASESSKPGMLKTALKLYISPDPAASKFASDPPESKNVATVRSTAK